MDTSAFGIGETRRLDLPPGQETTIRATSEVSRVKLTFGDGAEVELTLAPNEAVRIRQGRESIDIQLKDAGVSVHDDLKDVE